MCRCLLLDDGGKCVWTYQDEVIQIELISDRVFELSLWQVMLGTLMTDWKHVDGNQYNVCTPVRGFLNSLSCLKQCLPWVVLTGFSRAGSSGLVGTVVVVFVFLAFARRFGCIINSSVP